MSGDETTQCGAGLLIRSFARLQHVDPGFQADRALSFRLSLPDERYDNVAKRIAFFDALLAHLRSSPGVASAAATTFAPMSGREFGTSFVVTGTREIGIRLALGAPGQRVRGRVLRDAMMLAGLGITIGLVAALQVTRLMATLLFELTPTDPITLGTAVIVLFGVALLASYLPARRATRVDPVIALRAE